MTNEADAHDPLDETRKSYVAVARKALAPCLDPLRVPHVLVTGGGGFRCYALHVPRIDPQGQVGALSNVGDGEVFTFWDGRDLRRILLALLAVGKVAAEQRVELGEAGLETIRRAARDVAASAAQVEAWDGF